MLAASAAFSARRSGGCLAAPSSALCPVVSSLVAAGRGAALLAQQASLGWHRKLPRKLWE